MSRCRALAGLVALAQRRQDADRGIERRVKMSAMATPAFCGSPSGIAGQVHDPAHGLDHEVVAGARRVGAVWPKPVIEQ